MTVNEIQFGLMPENGTNYMFMLRGLEEEYVAKIKKIMCFEDLEKTLDREPRKV